MTRRSRTWWTVLAGVAALGLVAVLLFDWNWLKPIVEAQASRYLDRPVHITRLDVKLARRPLVIVDGFTVENAPGFAEGQLAEVQRMAFTVDVGQRLRHGRWVFPDMTLEKPVIRFERNAEGAPNWRFRERDESTEPQIGRLIVTDGQIRVINPQLKTDIEMTIHTEQGQGGEPEVVVAGSGRYAATPTKIAIRGGSLLSLREENIRYPVKVDWQIGDTRVLLDGTVNNPASFSGLDGQLDLRGRDLADLYLVFGIPLPPTAPYHLSGRIVYGDHLIWFEKFQGTAGKSDLSGTVSFDTRGERLLMSGELASKKLELDDLAGFVGADPDDSKKPAAGTQKRKVAAKSRNDGLVLPNDPIDLAKLSEMDAHVTYKAQRVEADYMPLDNLSAKLDLVNGRFRLTPLNFGIGKGVISMIVDVDARAKPAKVAIDADFRGVDLNRIMRKTKMFEGAGRIGGRIKVAGRGQSAHEVMSSGDGSVALAMGGGRISAVLTELAGLDLLEALGFTLTDKDRQFAIRCMVVEAPLEKGSLITRTLVLDTSDTNIVGSASVNFRDESIKGRLEPSPKDVSVLSLRAPINLGGTLANPSAKPDMAVAGGKAAAAIGLGALLGPLAALIPTIELGLGKDSDCAGLIADVQKKGGPKAKAQ
jgi:uncharacterized protein involved in outer membrane biogenesis